LSTFHIDTLAVCGVGLIGGSFALALKHSGAVRRVVGAGRSRENLERALAVGAIDEIASDAGAAARGSDLIFVAVPVQQTEAVLGQVAAAMGDAAIVTDAGSTKQDVIASAQRAMGPKIERFVPAHPIAGAEKSGADAASAALYRDRLVVLTPLPGNPLAAVELVRGLWLECGARVARMAPREHDEVFAAVSHLPHALAFALVAMMAARDESTKLFSHAGAGFRDFSRIAGSSPEMWRDICLANAPALLNELDAYQSTLSELASLIRKGDGAGVEAVFSRAREARARWLDECGKR
jgi:prephenate dehydrogenase